MFVIRRKYTDQYLVMHHTTRIELTDLQSCRTFPTRKGAKTSLRNGNTRFWLATMEATADDFEVVPVLISLVP